MTEKTDTDFVTHDLSALGAETFISRERVLAFVRQMARECPMGPIVASAFQTLTQDIENGERAP